ncbi:MAG: right-handed parallel beta-helix repeat-containing protein [Deltaproteobacteria bacterium]|nr:right-handed parallel beta-helix repeat-containing protein [Deltaproteobacteria bacterium]
MRHRTCFAGAQALAFLASASTAWAAKVVVASDGSPSALTAALDALGGPGVVVVPPGEFAFDGSVSIPSDDVTILGAGTAHTRLYRAKDAADPKDAAQPFLKAYAKNRVRIAHLAIEGVATAGSTAGERGILVQNGLDFRVDHTELSSLGFAAVYTSGESRGVVDHNVIRDGFKTAIGNYGYGVCVMGTGTYSKLPFGSPEATFAEDNRITGARHAAAANNAGRYVFRYNHVAKNENSHAVDAHGDEYNSTDTGTEWIEVHHNTIEAPLYKLAAVRIRGGKGIVWANTISGYTYGTSLWKKTPQTTGPVYLWDNVLGAGVAALGDVQGTVTSKLAPAPNYQPYVYPHPLVVDLEPDAGPDLVVAASGATGSVYIDGSASKAALGTVDGFAWHAGNSGVVSTCARDVLALPEGDHVLLLEATRTDGLTEHDTALVRVLPAGPLVSTPTWSSRDFVPLLGKGTVTFTLTPKAFGQDAYVGVTGRHEVLTHEDVALAVRTNTKGKFDARNGDAYGADTVIAYQAGKTYEVTLDVDLAAQTYDVSIDGHPLAKGFAFRRAEAQLGRVVGWHATGSLKTEGLAFAGEVAEPDPACAKGPGPEGAGGASGAGGAGSGPDAGGAGGATSTGGAGGANGGGGATNGGGGGEAAGGGAKIEVSVEEGSSCSLGRTPSDGHGALLGLAAAAWLARRRRR